MLCVRCRFRAGSNDQFNGVTRHANVGMASGPRAGDPRTVLVAVGWLRSHANALLRARSTPVYRMVDRVGSASCTCRLGVDSQPLHPHMQRMLTPTEAAVPAAAGRGWDLL